jgi:hypothetical protein
MSLYQTIKSIYQSSKKFGETALLTSGLILILSGCEGWMKTDFHCKVLFNGTIENKYLKLETVSYVDGISKAPRGDGTADLIPHHRVFNRLTVQDSERTIQFIDDSLDNKVDQCVVKFGLFKDTIYFNRNQLIV